MKILQLCNKVPYPPIDGGAIATLNLTKGFANHGNSVTMLAINTKKHFCDLSKIPDEINKIVKIIGVDLDTKISPYEALNNLIFSKLPYIAERFVSKDYENKLIELLQTENFDIVQIEGLYLGLYIPIIRKHSKALIALRAHNIEHEIWKRTAAQEENKLKKFYLEILANRIKKLKLKLMNSYDVLIPITARDGEVFRDLGNTKPMHISPAGTSLDHIKVDRTNIEFPSLFHIGALDWSPNQEGLIWFFKNVWPIVHEKFPTLKFYLAGRNAPDWIIKKIPESAVYLGEIENAYDFMNSKAIMIVPLFSGSGMRIKIIEGMALGKTIITTSVGTEGIESTKNHNILIANKTEDFISAINKVVSNFEFFEQIGKNAITFANENFNNKIISKSLLDFYSSNIK
jgi:polysaccharide biosynthesis protein PslH